MKKLHITQHIVIIIKIQRNHYCQSTPKSNINVTTCRIQQYNCYVTLCIVLHNNYF